MVNDSHSPIPQVEGKKKLYTSRDLNRDDCVRQFQHIAGQAINLILYAVDNNILQNLPILREDIRVSGDIYVPSVAHFQGKMVRHKIHHMEPFIVPSFPKYILDKHKTVTLFCDLINSNDIVFLDTIYRHIMFSTGSMI